MASNIEAVTFDFEDVRSFGEVLDGRDVAYVVNCVALADVDRCENEPELAMTINAQIPGRIAAVCQDRGVPFVHVSTDAVFDGHDSEYTVESTPHPINTYGRSKLAGENLVLESNPNALILRTNIVGWSPSGRRSLFEFFVNNLRSQTSCDGFTDITFRPISAWWFASILQRFLFDDVKGLHHIVGIDLLSKFEFGTIVAEALNVNPDLVKPTQGNTNTKRTPRSPMLNLLPSPRLIPLSMPIKEQLAQLLELEKQGLRAELGSFVSQG